MDFNIKFSKKCENFKEKKLLIHAGLHKTGSTYIQSSLSKNYVNLKRNGILYPMVGRSSGFGHHDLIRMIRKDNISTIREKFKDEEFLKYDTVIISSENFEYLDSGEIETLLEIFKEFTPKLFIYYRTWGSLLHSVWQEEIKHGSCMTYDRFCLENISFPFGSRFLNFTTFVNNVLKNIDGKNIFIASYNNVKSKYDILNFFMKIFNLDVVSPNADIKMNVSLDPVTIEIIRVLNEFGFENGYRRNLVIRQIYLQEFKKIENKEQYNYIKTLLKDSIMKAIDFSQTFAFKSFIRKFIFEYSDLICDYIENYEEEVRKPENIPFIVTQSYQKKSEVNLFLRDLWSKLEEVIKTNRY